MSETDSRETGAVAESHVSHTDEKSLFEALGGEPGLRAIIDDFVDRVFGDAMIGFFFEKADRARIKAKEYELAAAHLGADVVYTGRGLPEAHAKHPILGGHFQRRLQILKETLAAHAAPEAVVEHWVAHTERMRSAITRREGNDCEPLQEPEPRRLPLAFAAMVKPKENAPRVAPDLGLTRAARRELPLVGAPNPERGKK